MMSTQRIRACLAVLAGIVLCTISLTAQNKVRIIQTNSAGDNVSVIDPVTNKVVGVIDGIEAGHGAGVAPAGSPIYVPAERGRPLDVAYAQTLKGISRVSLSA